MSAAGNTSKLSGPGAPRLPADLPGSDYDVALNKAYEDFKQAKDPSLVDQLEEAIQRTAEALTANNITLRSLESTHTRSHGFNVYKESEGHLGTGVVIEVPDATRDATLNATLVATLEDYNNSLTGSQEELKVALEKRRENNTDVTGDTGHPRRTNAESDPVDIDWTCRHTGCEEDHSGWDVPYFGGPFSDRYASIRSSFEKINFTALENYLAYLAGRSVLLEARRTRMGENADNDNDNNDNLPVVVNVDEITQDCVELLAQTAGEEADLSSLRKLTGVGQSRSWRN